MYIISKYSKTNKFEEKCKVLLITESWMDFIGLDTYTF